MAVQEEIDDQPYSEDYYVANPAVETGEHRKQIKRLLEDKLERKRLRDECRDEFIEDFDWEAKD